MMTITQLRYFLFVVKCGNITEAARNLHISQPALSSSIRDIENDLGVMLFERAKKNNITLTTYGEVLAKEVEEILVNLDNLEIKMRDFGSRQRSIVKCSIPPITGSVFLPLVCGEFRKLHPEIHLEIHQEYSEEGINRVNDGSYDVAIIGRMDFSHPNMISKKIYTTEMCLVTSHDNLLSQLPSISYENIKDEPLVTSTPGTFHNSVLMNIFKEHNAAPNIVLYTDQLHSSLELVREGIASSILSREVAAFYKEVAAIPLAKPAYMELSIIRSKRRYLSEATQTLINFIVKKGASAVGKSGK